MSILSGLLGGGDDTESESILDIFNDLDSDNSAGFENESYSRETDSDGSSEENYERTSLNVDSDISSITDSVFESMSEMDSLLG